MNSKFPRQTVSPRENLLHINRSLLAAMMIADEETIGTSREKARCKYPFLVRQLSVFFTPAKYMAVKIVRSCSNVVLRTTKRIIFYPGSSSSLKIIALRPAV
jgi:hypothetical protein